MPSFSKTDNFTSVHTHSMSNVLSVVGMLCHVDTSKAQDTRAIVTFEPRDLPRLAAFAKKDISKAPMSCRCILYVGSILGTYRTRNVFNSAEAHKITLYALHSRVPCTEAFMDMHKNSKIQINADTRGKDVAGG